METMKNRNEQIDSLLKISDGLLVPELYPTARAYDRVALHLKDEAFKNFQSEFNESILRAQNQRCESSLLFKQLEAKSKEASSDLKNQLKGLRNILDSQSNQLDLLKKENKDFKDDKFLERGWQQLSGSIELRADEAGDLRIFPTVSPYFEPKAIQLFGVDPMAASTNLRFMIGSVTVGGSPQLAINAWGDDIRKNGILSDVFNRGDEPLPVNWSVFSTQGLARELIIRVFNLNQMPIKICACIWGNAVASLNCYA